MGQQQAQIAELMAGTRASHATDGVARLAADKVNRAILAAAKENNSSRRLKSDRIRVCGDGLPAVSDECENNPYAALS